MFEILDKLVLVGLGLIVTGLTWLLRIVFTNNTKIVVLETRLDKSDDDNKRRHEETRESIKTLVAVNERATDTLQKIVEKVLDKHE